MFPASIKVAKYRKTKMFVCVLAEKSINPNEHTHTAPQMQESVFVLVGIEFTGVIFVHNGKYFESNVC